MKRLYFLLVVLLVLPILSAENLIVTKQSSGETLVVGTGQPVVFDMKVKNLERSDYFEFYNLLGFNMFPKGKVYIERGETKEIRLELYPIGEIKNRGHYTIDYYISGENSTEEKKELSFKIIELMDLFTVNSDEINPDSDSVVIYFQNRENVNFTNAYSEFSSPFFKIERNFSIGPYEKKNFTINLEKEEFKKLTAGFYTLNAKVKVGDEEAKIEGVIKFSEKDEVVTTEENYGIIVHTQILKKVNEGNLVATSQVTFKKNIISRLFTTFTPEPDFVDRENFRIYYTWNRQIKPGETFEMKIQTNWFFPLLIVILIVVIIILAKRTKKTDLSLVKKVSFVRTKGGEFALKVNLFVHANRYIERISITDRLPMLVKLHERFGAEKPTRVNEKTRRIEWNFDKLEEGESRVLSYIIYSKIGILGKFALPSASAVFEREGKISETESNRTFFVAEQKAEKNDSGDF